MADANCPEYTDNRMNIWRAQKAALMSMSALRHNQRFWKNHAMPLQSETAAAFNL
jgi:hypothetical protein